jgi:hypothetical protein
MGQRRQPRKIGYIHIEQALLVWLNLILHRPIEALDEGRRHQLLPRFNVNRRGSHVIRVLVLWAHVDQCHTLPVHRDLQLLSLGLVLAEQVALLVRVEGDLEHIVSIGGKVVLNRHAAARSERRTCNAACLRDDSGNHGGRHHRRSQWIAYCRPADLACSGDVGLKQGRRHRKHVGHVIKPVAHVVGRQKVCCIHIQTKKRLH